MTGRGPDDGRKMKEKNVTRSNGAYKISIRKYVLRSQDRMEHIKMRPILLFTWFA